MKKHVLTAVAVLSIAFGASAQQNVDVKINKYKVDPNQDLRRPISTIHSKGGPVSTFFEVHEAVLNESVNKQYTPFASLMFPDTNTVVLGLTAQGVDTTFYNNFNHAMGQVFDPTAEVWDFYQASNPEAQRFNRQDKYTVDSMYYMYTYTRFIDKQAIGGNPEIDVVDTLFIEYFKSNATTGTTNGGMNYGRIVYQLFNDTQDFSRPEFNLATRLSTAPVKRETILLTNADTANTNDDKTFSFRIVVRPVDIDIAPNEIFAAVLQFRPGSVYNVGDTILAQGNIKPDHKTANLFGVRILSYAVDGDFSQQFKQTDNYNNSVFIPAGWNLDQADNRNGWDYGYYPSLEVFPFMGFHITGQSTVGISKINNDYVIGNVYPNPARAGQNVTVEFSAKNASTVSVELFDLLGKKVNTTISINGNNAEIATNDLSSGMYIINLKSDNQTVSTKKINIVR